MSLFDFSYFASVAESRASQMIGSAGLLGLAAVGTASALYPALKVLSFINFYFIRHSSVKKYLSDDPSRPAYALVTGATDGIGKAIAAELADKGFNLVLHGRNEKKLEGIKADLVRRFPTRTFRTFVFDANDVDKEVVKLESAVAGLTDINLVILVNNVGGWGPVNPGFRTILDLSMSDITAQLRLNVTFTILLTKLLMPQLRKTVPTLVLNIGSAASEMPGIYQTAYAGSKGFLKTWSAALNDESRAEGWKVESSLMIAGPVITETFKAQGMKVTMTQPSSRDFAKSVVHVAGSRYAVVYPYWAHRAFFALIAQLPKAMQINAIKDIAKDFMDKKAA